MFHFMKKDILNVGKEYQMDAAEIDERIINHLYLDLVYYKTAMYMFM